MSFKRKAYMSDVEMFSTFDRLEVKMEDVRERVLAGEKLEIKLSDSGDEASWSLLYCGGKRIGYWPGY